MTSHPITERDKLIEIEREIEHRHRVYKKLIAARKMTSSAASRKIQIMTAVRDDYRERIAAQPCLFGGRP